MIALTLEELQSIELNILKSFKAFCEENNLKYSLAAGTLIGAVRHKGFIPWDDDIDVFMMRTEYDKFLSLINKGFVLNNKDYVVWSPEKRDSFYPFIKIIDKRTILYETNMNRKFVSGVWIDIFPVDFCGDDFESAKKLCVKMKADVTKYLRYHRKYKCTSFINIMKNVYVWGMHIFKRKEFLRIERELFSYRNDIKSKYCGTLIWATNKKDLYPSEFFGEYSMLRFEDDMFMVFKDYDKILTHRYGNYMKIPDEKERQSHNPEAYLIEKT